jgi:hypothetical protein
MSIIYKSYNNDFYSEVTENAINNSRIIVPLVLKILPPINSVVDFGCGEGAWLSVFLENGVKEILGIDGPWINKDKLKINRDNFIETNFEKGISLERKYDLAVSLEVAEHLPLKVSKFFIDSLTKSSDFIMFSAAVPFQGGTNHINEQWPDYWNALFNENGYIAIDCIRSKIWNNKKLSYIYKQNIVMYARKEAAYKVNMAGPDFGNQPQPLSLVHPDLYVQDNIKVISLRRAIKIILRRLMKKLV